MNWTKKIDCANCTKRMKFMDFHQVEQKSVQQINHLQIYHLHIVHCQYEIKDLSISIFKKMWMTICKNFF